MSPRDVMEFWGILGTDLTVPTTKKYRKQDIPIQIRIVGTRRSVPRVPGVP